MHKAWAEIQRLIDVNARHRKGFCLGEVSDEQILRQAAAEIEELRQSPLDPTELADAIAPLFHYAIKHGWTMEYIEELMLRKFKERFSECEESSPAMTDSKP